ncbi:hypothetical protein [Pseudomonas luteola]|uniref:hypothetical protein n=1 Tax=Pseudomonas luteola TaxID=47886 RepID=UPI00123ABD8D|nr:hypothetical protein [Pseudomonas luteola]QEU29593.1 hypothetical protein FOB45_18230 [Pseudomonas luteola]
MRTLRWMVSGHKPCWLALVLILSGCDKSEKEPPKKPAEPQAASVEQTAPKPVSPAASHAKPVPDTSARQEPILTSRVPESFDEEPVPAPQPDKKPELVIEKPKPKPLPKTVKQKLPEPEEPLKVDLSIPKELIESAVPVTAEQKEPTGMLPPLFDKHEENDRFNLSGRILNRERSDDFEGAELQFEFRR